MLGICYNECIIRKNSNLEIIFTAPFKFILEMKSDFIEEMRMFSTKNDKHINAANRRTVASNQTNMHQICFSIYLIFIIFCSLFLSLGECFNVDIKHPVIVASPSKNYYFGQAVDMYTDNDEETW